MKAFLAILSVLLLATSARADMCSQCEQIVQAIESWLASNDTISEIEQQLDQLCALMPQWQIPVISSIQLQ